MLIFWSRKQWAESRGAEIKLPPGAGAEITNFGSGSSLFIKDSKKFYLKKLWLYAAAVHFFLADDDLRQREWIFVAV